MGDPLEPDLLQLEAQYWDRMAMARSASGRIPITADIRRATRVVPQRSDEEPVDPVMSAILLERHRTRLIGWATHAVAGRVLDIGCGPGWLALELGRRGQVVDAYDLSSEAIAIAKRVLTDNSYCDGFGQVNYYAQDITKVDLGREKYDAVTAWSVLHHLPNLPEFIDRLWVALKPGGVVAILDDLPQEGWCEQLLQRTLSILLPSYHRTYGQKLWLVWRWLSRRYPGSPMCSSPLEALSTAEIDPLIHDYFEVIEDYRYNAFVTLPLIYLKGPDWLRYGLARALVRFDQAMCAIGICKGVYRIMIARKASRAIRGQAAHECGRKLGNSRE